MEMEPFFFFVEFRCRHFVVFKVTNKMAVITVGPNIRGMTRRLTKQRR